MVIIKIDLDIKSFYEVSIVYEKGDCLRQVVHEMEVCMR